MNTPNLPNWVINICCITPFVALLAIAFSSWGGGTFNFVGLICLSTLCGKILQWILEPRDEPIRLIPNGKHE